MHKNPFAIPLFVLLLIGGFSCTTAFRHTAVSYKSYRLTDSLAKDSSALRLLQPYRDEVNRTMNEVVGTAGISLEKSQPESTLGNFMVDAFFVMASEKYDTHVDVAFLNFGGMRLTQLPAGPVTSGKIFELMPFDNLLILQKLKGTVLQEFLDLIAAKGGWPVAGMQMEIRDKKAVNVLIGGKPLDPDAVYTTVNSDFLANGGDNADMLRAVPQISNGYLMRDAIFDYIKKRKAGGMDIRAVIENRVRYAQ